MRCQWFFPFLLNILNPHKIFNCLMKIFFQKKRFKIRELHTQIIIHVLSSLKSNPYNENYPVHIEK